MQLPWSHQGVFWGLLRAGSFGPALGMEQLSWCACGAMQQLLVPHLSFCEAPSPSGPGCVPTRPRGTALAGALVVGLLLARHTPRLARGLGDTDLCLWLFLLLQHRHSWWVCCPLLLHLSHILNWVLLLSCGYSWSYQSPADLFLVS